MGRTVVTLVGALSLLGLASASLNPVMRRQDAAATTTAAARYSSYESLTSCRMSETIQYCRDGSTEWRIVAAATATGDPPSSYTACHAHGSETWCMNPSGGEVKVIGALATLTTKAAASAASETGTITTTSQITAITGCHLHSNSIYCLAGSKEFYVSTTVTATQDVPAQYTGCHAHDTDLWCMTKDSEVKVIPAENVKSGSASTTASSEPQGENCHFHAGVEHCVGSGESENGSTSTTNCERRDREYKIPIRVGMLFVVLVASSIGVFGPIIMSNFYQVKTNIFLTILKQFGTGVIISTAFVHLYTHASMMFNNKCMYKLEYEGVTSAIVMAGLFISFLIEFIVSRTMRWQAKKKTEAESETDVSPKAVASQEMANISIMEAGIIFHSLLIGITLVVAGDSFFTTLTVVIVFHQLFEGIALGTRIAALGYGTTFSHMTHMHAHDAPAPKVDRSQPCTVPLSKKLFLASGFAIVTPIGMAIGIGVLKKFNGNDPATLVAIGTLDAFSAGILIWVGLVEMWAHDWMLGGELTEASALTTTLAMFGLVAGMALMSLLGKWA